MKRRSFLQMVGLAPFVGTKAVEQAVKETAATQAMQMAGVSALGFSGSSLGAAGESPTETAEWAAKRIPEVLADLAKIKAMGRDRLVAKIRREDSGSVHVLDPDLVANRSFSISTKIRIQRERNIHARADDRVNWLQNQLANLQELAGLS